MTAYYPIRIKMIIMEVLHIPESPELIFLAKGVGSNSFVSIFSRVHQVQQQIPVNCCSVNALGGYGAYFRENR